MFLRLLGSQSPPKGDPVSPGSRPGLWLETRHITWLGAGRKLLEAKGVSGDYATSFHQGLGDAFEVTEELLLVGVRL